MEGSTMGNHRSRTVEWVLRAVEVAAVFSAMSWALFWALTHRRSALAAPRPPPAEAEDLPPSWWARAIDSIRTIPTEVAPWNGAAADATSTEGRPRRRHQTIARVTANSGAFRLDRPIVSKGSLDDGGD